MSSASRESFVSYILYFCLLLLGLAYAQSNDDDGTESTYTIDPKWYKITSPRQAPTFEINCPDHQAADGLIIEWAGDNLTAEWQYTLYCRHLTNTEYRQDSLDGKLACRNTQWYEVGDEMPWDDVDRNCYCNEYLAGIHGKLGEERDQRNQKIVRRYRLTRFRCCNNDRSFAQPLSCEFIGPKELLRPLGTRYLADNEEEQEGPRKLITGLTFVNQEVMVRFCKYYILDAHPEAKSMKKKAKDNSCDFYMKRGFLPSVDVDGCRVTVTIPKPIDFTNQDVLWVTKMKDGLQNLMFQTQYTMCRDGMYVRNIYKYPRTDPKTGIKDYVFLTKCHDMEAQSCFCFINDTCSGYATGDECQGDEESSNDKMSGGNKTDCKVYIAGISWDWDKQLRQRKIKNMFCCISSSMHHVECNKTKWLGDKDVAMILPSPRFAKRGDLLFGGGGGMIPGQAKSIRDMEIKWEGTNMLVQYEICRMNSSSFPCPLFPCFQFPFTTSTMTTTTPCNTAKYDFMYVVDESASITSPNFQKVKQFLVDFTDQFTIGPDDTRAGLIKFATQASLQWGMTQYTAKSDLEGAISALPYNEGATNIALGLSTSLPIFQQEGRQGVKQVAFLVTDGIQNQPGDEVAAGKLLRDNGIEIIIVGVGPEVDANKLAQIAGSSDRVYLATTFDSLADAVQGAVDNLCDE